MRSRAGASTGTRTSARTGSSSSRRSTPRVEPERFTEEDGRIAVDVHQVVHSREGELLADQRVRHVYTVRDGLIERMEIED